MLTRKKWLAGGLGVVAIVMLPVMLGAAVIVTSITNAANHPAAPIALLSQFIPPGPPANPFTPAPETVKPPAPAPDVVKPQPDPFKLGFWQTDKNGATGRGQCNGDRFALRHTPEGPVTYLQGMNGSAAGFPVHKHEYTQISPDTYSEDVGLPPEVRITYRVVDTDMVIRERVEAINEGRLIYEFGSVSAGLDSYNASAKVIFYRCHE